MFLSHKFPVEHQTLLVTGGSQGLGKQFARKYFAEGTANTVIVVSRSAAKLAAAVKDITGQDAQELTVDLEFDSKERNMFYIPCDLSDYHATERMYELLLERNLSPTQVMLCAGGSTPKLFKDLTGDELVTGVQVNYMTCLNLAHVLTRKHSSLPHVIFFSSETAFFPFIGYSQYAPMKQSIKALVMILRQEFPESRISCVYPGNFESEGFEVETLTKPEITKSIEGASTPISCDECCNKIVYWLDKGYDDITTDFIGWVLMSTDMGLNKHNNNSFLWILQLLLGCIANLIVVPIYMAMCHWEIKGWLKKQHRSKSS